MCVPIFGGRSTPTPLPQPAAYQPRVQQQKQEAVRPEKKELLDPDAQVDVEFGSGQKKSGPAAGKKTGTDALKINVNTGGNAGAGTGGLNV